MRVLLWIPLGDKIPGGHRIQFDQTAHHLRQLGTDAVVSFETDPSLAGYDLIHGFGISLGSLRRCRRLGLPVVLSTIYWARNYIMGISSPQTLLQKWRSRSRTGFVLLNSALRGNHIAKCEAMVRRLSDLRATFEAADMLLPNSIAEADTIRAELEVTTPYHVVPNAVDPVAFNTGQGPPEERTGVLYVGRFEPHKNQLGLIQAMRHLALPTTLVGPPHPHHAKYYDNCRATAGTHIKIAPAVLHENLPQVYQKAKVHVLPSWFETTGLVSLEAALCGCNIVTTDRGYARDYFGDMAWYCNPADPKSIRAAVAAAHEAPVRTELRERILNSFTWRHTAQATIEAYNEVLELRRSNPSFVTPNSEILA